ncbi:MAG: sugar phosphate nucleotidyltransferase, partial [Candidatus Nealsonbacteria bacterium]
MQAVIIAAGESSRFWPLNHNHKSQIKILGHSLVYWTVKGLVSKGISNVIIVVSPNSFNQEMLQEEVQGLGIDISFVVQEKPLGTGNAVLQAKDLIKEPFFIFWPYKIISADVVEDILKVVQADGAELVLVGAKTKTPWDYGMARIENNQVKEIVE